MKVTIQDVADAAQVAKSTVSKVINDSPKISAATKLRVWEIMKQLNYTPSSLATQLAKQSSRNIALLIDMSKESEFLNQFFYNIIGGIESSLVQRRFELTLSNIQAEPQEQHFMNRLVLSKRIDGLIANNSILTDELCAELNRLKFPFISIGEVNADVSWVDFDNKQGGEMLTTHLLAQGYSDIAFIGGEQDEKLFTNRYQGYANAMREAGLPLLDDPLLRGQADENTGYRVGLQLLQAKNRPDAVVCMSNYTASGVLKAARELNIAVPQTLGITAFDDYPLSAYTTPPLTCLKIDTFQLGVAAGKMLLDHLHEPDHSRQALLLEPQLIVRESTQRE